MVETESTQARSAVGGAMGGVPAPPCRAGRPPDHLPAEILSLLPPGDPFEHVMALAPQLGALRIVCHSISPVVLHMVAVRGFRRPNGDPASAPTLDLGAPDRA